MSDLRRRTNGKSPSLEVLVIALLPLLLSDSKADAVVSLSYHQNSGKDDESDRRTRHRIETSSASSASASMIMVLIATGMTTAILGLANYVQLNRLRAQQSQLFEELGTTLSSVDGGGVDSSGTAQPRVWIQGKKVIKITHT